MSPKEEHDEWVFDTVKAPTIAVPKHTQKRREFSLASDVDPAEAEKALRQLDLNVTTTQTQPCSYSTVRKASQPMPTASPARKPSGQKQPLVPDMSFGNGASTVRQFSRVSDNSPNTSPEASIAQRDENRPPLAETVTREALLGRKVYSRVVDHAFQETYAQTGSQAKREAIARVADAWNALDAVDPEGEYHLLRAIINKIDGEPRLASFLPSSPTVHTPPKPRLILDQSNPHLKSHRRRQSMQSTLSDDKIVDRQRWMPGEVVPGMEHTSQLADVLYGRWIGGLMNRWAVT